MSKAGDFLKRQIRDVETGRYKEAQEQTPTERYEARRKSRSVSKPAAIVSSKPKPIPRKYVTDPRRETKPPGGFLRQQMYSKGIAPPPSSPVMKDAPAYDWVPEQYVLKS